MQARRRQRRRRLRAAGFLLALVAAAAAGAVLAIHLHGHREPVRAAAAVAKKPAKPKALQPRPQPAEIRGVHVTMALASLPGKLQEYIAMKRDGLNAIELDVKDENGEIGFVPADVPLARQVGAA